MECSLIRLGFRSYFCFITTSVAHYRHDIVAAHSITKRDADILYMGIRKVHYNVMRFKDTMTSDEADALAGRAKSVSAQHYVLHDLKSFADKYVKAWDSKESNCQALCRNCHANITRRRRRYH